MPRRWPAAFAALVVLGAVTAVALAIAPGTIKTVAGNGTFGFSGDNGPATAAQIADPRGVAALPDGSFLIADTANDRIRKVDRSGKITTVAGKAPGGAFSGDNGPATQAQLAHPRGVEPLPDGGFLIADSSNNRVRRVDPSGKITTVAGDGGANDAGDGGPAGAASLAFPRDISLLPNGAGYLVADHNACTVRKVDRTGKISTVAGVANSCFPVDGDNGPATSAHIGLLTNVEALPAGGFLISDGTGDRIRKVDASGKITTIVGGDTGGYSGDNGPAKNAKIDGPRGIAALPGGGFLFADSHNGAIRKVDAAGTITTVAGKQPPGSFGGDDGPAKNATLNEPEYVALMPDGGFLIMDTGNERVRRVYGNAPVNTARPKITGTAFPGATLTCSPGTWANGPTSFSFAWFRGTTKLAETSAAYRVVKGDRGRKLTCRVIAGNDVGLGAPAYSNPRGVAKLTLAGKPKARHGAITFKVHCAAAACHGKATETRKSGKRTAVAGSRSFKVAAGKTRRVTVRLNKAGRAALDRSFGKLRVKLTIAQTAGARRIVIARVKRTLTKTLPRVGRPGSGRA